MEWEWIRSIGSVIGALIGIGALFVSISNYRRLNSIKSLDLRLEAKRAFNEAHANVERIHSVLEKAARSREDLFTHAGHNESSVRIYWREQREQDAETIAALRTELENIGEFEDLRQESLEGKIVQMDQINKRISVFLQKYQEQLAEDGRQWEQIDRNRSARQ